MTTVHQAGSAQASGFSHNVSGARWACTLQRTVQEWYSESGRDFPWRQSSSPFHVLVAEVLLRRTQAERVVGPYLDLTERYPDTQDMASADVAWLREWFRPLGLVSRADLLVNAAKTVVQEHGGEIPRDLSEVESLPGMGRYSARALLCIAYGRAVPMVDESSGRLLRRLLGLRGAGPAYSDRKLLERTEALVPHKTSKAFNLGLLDIAAAYCHVSAPSCVRCPLQNLCSWGQLVAEDATPRGIDD